MMIELVTQKTKTKSADYVVFQVSLHQKSNLLNQSGNNAKNKRIAEIY